MLSAWPCRTCSQSETQSIPVKEHGDDGFRCSMTWHISVRGAGQQQGGVSQICSCSRGWVEIKGKPASARFASPSSIARRRPARLHHAPRHNAFIPLLPAHTVAPTSDFRRSNFEYAETTRATHRASPEARRSRAGRPRRIRSTARKIGSMEISRRGRTITSRVRRDDAGRRMRSQIAVSRPSLRGRAAGEGRMLRRAAFVLWRLNAAATYRRCFRASHQAWRVLATGS